MSVKIKVSYQSPEEWMMIFNLMKDVVCKVSKPMISGKYTRRYLTIENSKKP